MKMSFRCFFRRYKADLIMAIVGACFGMMMCIGANTDSCIERNFPSALHQLHDAVDRKVGVVGLSGQWVDINRHFARESALNYVFAQAPLQFLALVIMENGVPYILLGAVGGVSIVRLCRYVRQKYREAMHIFEQELKSLQ